MGAGARPRRFGAPRSETFNPVEARCGKGQLGGIGLRKRWQMAVATALVAGLAGCGPEAGAPGQDVRPGAGDARDLNPRRLPPLAMCETVLLGDPVAAAKANIHQGDRRPFTIASLGRISIPGVFCPSGDYWFESRGGLVISDVPPLSGETACAPNVPPEQMELYNRTLAADARFQQATGCRPSTYCEERYGKWEVEPDPLDPRCPGTPAVR